VRRQSTGADCTYEVVQEIVAAAQPDAVADLLPGVLPAGGLGNATSPLSALGSLVSLLSGSGSASETDDRSSSRRGLRPGWGEWGQGGKPRRSKTRGSANWPGLDAGETNGDGE
jgi:hypothetical protein